MERPADYFAGHLSLSYQQRPTRSAPTGGVDDGQCHVGSRLGVFRFRALARAQPRTQEEVPGGDGTGFRSGEYSQ
jgi:hypothetical protein